MAAGVKIPSRVRVGVRIAGSGSAHLPRVLRNSDLERMMDTSDEWIVKRTGIRERRLHAEGQTTSDIAHEAVAEAIRDAGVDPAQVDFVVCATMTPDMPTPSVAAVVASRLGRVGIGAIDMNAACSGWVFALNVAHDLVSCGRYRCVAVVGADIITRHMEFTTEGRGTSILFGDGAAAVVLRADDDPAKGLLAECMHSDGGGAKDLFIPTKYDRPAEAVSAEASSSRLDYVYMNGQAVFKFAVSKFPEVIQETLDKAGLKASDVDHYVCHQANLRILEAARERFGLSPERLAVNIDRYGNTVSASVPLVFDEIRRAGRVREGQRVMFIAFGAGLTWGASLWQL